MLKNSLSSQTFEKKNPSSITLIEENKNLEENLIKEMKVNINKNIKEIKGEELKNKVLNWLFIELDEEERKKICVIKSKMLINILIQIYLLFQKGNDKVELEPIDDIEIFFNESTSLNSFKLFSSMDERKEGKENSEKKIDVDELYYYKKYFHSYLSKKEEEEDFIKFIKIISLNDDDEFNTIMISNELTSDIEKFKKYFKICTNDNYFEDWLWPFENKNRELNFTMPVWMCKHFEKNLKFSFGQIIFGFFERQILLNYEYFYYTNKIYKLSYLKDITKLYEDNKTLENLLLNDLITFNKFISKAIINTIIKNIKKKEKYKKKNKEIRDICNKVYFDNFNFPFISRDKLYEVGFDQIIVNEIKSYINGSKDDNLRVKKFVDKLTFLNFSDIINFSQFIYSSYRYFLIKYLSMEEAKKINKINKINEIHNIYSKSSKNVNDNSNSKNSIRTDYKSEKLSICDDDSFSINSDISQKSYKTMTSNENNNYIHNNPFEIFCNNYYTKGLNDYCMITENNLSILNNIRKQKLNKLINIINEKFKNNFDLTIGNYGSYFTDLSIEGSDMDICIIHKAKENANLNFYDELYNLLKEQKPFLYNIQQIYSEIPLIKLEIDITDEIKTPLCNIFNYIKYEDLTRIKIDINVSDNQEYLKNCEKNVEYVKSMVKKFPQIRPVLLFLKRYFKNMNMNKVYFGGISSYSLFLLTLNTIKSYSKNHLGISQLLLKVLEKFSSFDFKRKGISTNNYDYKLDFDNDDESLFILDPLTGKNVSYGRCKGGKLKKTFYNAYKLISEEMNKLKYCFYSGIYLINMCPINSFISVLNSRINFTY